MGYTLIEEEQSASEECQNEMPALKRNVAEKAAQPTSQFNDQGVQDPEAVRLIHGYNEFKSDKPHWIFKVFDAVCSPE